MPFFFVIAIYCYEGAGLILSLEASLAKEVRHKFTKYFVTTMILVTSLYISFGACGYLSFGPETNQIITLNLPKGTGLDFSILVKSFLCFALFCTYPVMMFPVMKILERYFLPDANNTMWKGNVMRGLVVVLTGMVVLAIPNFADLMALVGATCCTLLAFILPGIFHLNLFKGELSKRQLWFDWLLIALGICGTILGLWDALGRVSEAEDENLVSESSTEGTAQNISETLGTTVKTLAASVVKTTSKSGISGTNIAQSLTQNSRSLITNLTSAPTWNMLDNLKLPDIFENVKKAQ